MSDTKISEAAAAYQGRGNREGVTGKWHAISEFDYKHHSVHRTSDYEVRALYEHPQPVELAEQQGVCGLHDVAEKLRRAGATIPFPVATGTIKSSIIHGLCIALLLVEEAIAATGKQQVGEVQGDALTALVAKWRAQAATHEVNGLEADSIGLTTAAMRNDARAHVLEEAANELQAALAARQPGAQEPVADWSKRGGKPTDWRNELLTLAEHHDPIPAFARSAMRVIARSMPAPTAQAIDLRQLSVQHVAALRDMREHIAAGTLSLNDWRGFGTAALDAVLALIDQRDAAPGVGS